MAESKGFGWKYELFNKWSVKRKVIPPLRIIFAFTVVKIARITVHESNKNDLKDNKGNGRGYSFSEWQRGRTFSKDWEWITMVKKWSKGNEGNIKEVGIKWDKKLTIKVVNRSVSKENKIYRINNLVKYNGKNKVVLK